MKLSIIIPVYNSVSSLKTLYEKIESSLDISHEIIFVNDFSSDDSSVILEELRSEFCHVIHLNQNHGQQYAIFTGLKYASGDYIVTMDDDLQHDPKDILRLLHKIQEGYDLVYAISEDNYAYYRQFGSKMTGRFFKRRYKHMKDKRVSSFRIFTKALAQKTLNCSYRFIYLSAIMLGLTDNIGQIQVIKHQRLHGKSGYNLSKLIKLFIKLNYYYGPWPNTIKLKRVSNEETYDFRRG